jgi:hypothetical protein
MLVLVFQQYKDVSKLPIKKKIVGIYVPLMMKVYLIWLIGKLKWSKVEPQSNLLKDLIRKKIDLLKSNVLKPAKNQ